MVPSEAMTSGSGISNLSGTITNAGAVVQGGGTFVQRGGSETGNPAREAPG